MTREWEFSFIKTASAPGVPCTTPNMNHPSNNPNKNPFFVFDTPIEAWDWIKSAIKSGHKVNISQSEFEELDKLTKQDRIQRDFDNKMRKLK